MANAGNQRWQQRDVPGWSLKSDNQRQLPCHPSVKVRVKVIEPGVQSRWCDRCQDYRYFTLEPMAMLTDTLKLRWLDQLEVAQYLADLDEPEPEWLPQRTTLSE